MKWQQLTPNLMVEDVEASAAWYTELLGFTVDAGVPGDDGALNFAILHRDGIQLMLQRRASLEADVPTLKDVPIGASQTFFITVDEVDGLYAPLADRVETVVALHNTWYGTREVYFRDLNGYILCFSQQIAQE